VAPTDPNDLKVGPPPTARPTIHIWKEREKDNNIVAQDLYNPPSRINDKEIREKKQDKYDKARQGQNTLKEYFYRN